MVNYYKILKISQKASSAEIKSAYRRLARKKHPDKNEGSPAAAREFGQIAKAYRILSDPQERAYYDKKLLEFEFYSAPGSVASPTNSTVFDSDNPHARRLRQMAYEKRYNDIIDRMVAAERRESLALQRVIFPTVALFLSTLFVALFKPDFWANSPFVGKIIFFALFVVGVLHLYRRLRDAFERYTYNPNLHDSILDEVEKESKPYSRLTAAAFLTVGVAVSFGVGLLTGDFIDLYIAPSLPSHSAPLLRFDLLFYPPVVVLCVDLMHSFSLRFER